MRTREYRECARCVMDTSASQIEFDDAGICNYCTAYLRNKERIFFETRSSNSLDQLVDSISESGRGRDYDCVIGVSGGVDSTYVAKLVKELGLRPLAVHLDNGWNSELATSNIEQSMKKIGVDLFTHVLNWAQFRDIQVAFVKSSTPDWELPSDHAIRAVLLEAADRHGLKYIVNGRNMSTEGIMPSGWSYGPFDWKYLSSIHNKFGAGKISDYPYLNLRRLAYHYGIRGIKDINILNYVDYTKSAAVSTLSTELGWRDYGGKHFESIFTRFYQGVVLPKKFGIDKRRAHLSVLVASGQITRGEAKLQIQAQTYDAALQLEDEQYFQKKLDLSETQFNNVMNSPNKTFLDYPNNGRIFLLDENNKYYDLFRLMRRVRTFFA